MEKSEIVKGKGVTGAEGGREENIPYRMLF